MKITEVRIFPAESRDGKLKAFATMTFDDWFVVRNVKVIQGNNGLFVAMPSRKVVDPCPKCRFKNARGSRYCNQCGAEIGTPGGSYDMEKKEVGDHMDIAHPITQECRVYIQNRILEAYNSEKQDQKVEDRPYAASGVAEEQSKETEQPVSEEKEPGQQGNAEIASVSEGEQDIEL